MAESPSAVILEPPKIKSDFWVTFSLGRVEKQCMYACAPPPPGTRPPCPSPTPRAYSNSCPLSQWCHPTISSSVVPSPPTFKPSQPSGSFPISQFFTSGGQNIGASTSVLPKSIQDWFPLEFPGLIALKPKGLQESSPTPEFKSINSLAHSFLYSPTLTHPYMTTGKTIALTTQTFVGKVMSLVF